MKTRTLYHYQLQVFLALDNPFLDGAKLASLENDLDQQGTVLEKPELWQNPVNPEGPELDGAWVIQKHGETYAKWKLEYAESDWTEELEDLLAKHGLTGTVQTELVSWHAEEVLPESD